MMDTHLSPMLDLERGVRVIAEKFNGNCDIFTAGKTNFNSMF